MNPQDTPHTQPPPLEAPLPEQLDMKTLFEALLRRPHALVARLASGNHDATSRFATVAAISFLLFGFVIGCFAKHDQLWAAPAKITVGLLFSGVICFPSLYIFSTLAGARVSITQLAACFAGALALAGLLLLGFAPAIWIFAESTDSFGFMGTLAIGSWLIALAFALRFLKAVIFATGGSQKGPLTIWSVVFLLVTLQMTTSLRPILGTSDKLLTQEKKFFLQHWGDTFGEMLPKENKVKAEATTSPATESR
ncbi:MAG: hypothetical protein H8M99_02945 [Gloeobacteraceae cyanobacterium ES-bin-144]|nr:hypothetical protein [Verrucomicrobiales bacterium]